MNDDQFKEKVRSEVDLPRLVESYGVKLTQSGAEWKALCPFHNEKSPSFHVSPEKGWNCFGCGKGGDCFAFVMEKSGCDFPTALRDCARFAGIPMPSSQADSRLHSLRVVRKRGALSVEKFRPLTENSEAWNYLSEKRKIPAGILKSTRLWETHSKEEFFNGRSDWKAIAFVYSDPRTPPTPDKLPTVEFCKCLNIERIQKEDGKWSKVEWRHPEGRDSILYGMETASADAEHLIICEGEIDQLSWRAYGVDAAVSVPSGANSSPKWIDACFPWLEKFKWIHLSFDEDRAGQTKVREVLQRLGPERTDIVRLPFKPTEEGKEPVRYKDANECLQAGVTQDAMDDAVQSAEVVRPDKLRSVFDFEDEIWKKFHDTSEETVGHPLPWGNSNGKSMPFRWRYGEVTIWSGYNGHGKSQVLNHCIVDLGWRGVRTLICSLEMRAPETFRRIIRVFRAESRPADCDRSEFRARCLNPLAEKIWVYDHVGQEDLAGILDVALYARRRYGVRFLVIDSLMCLSVGSSDEKYEEQKSFVKKLCEFAAINGMHVVLVAHSKKTEGKGNREYSYPRKYDIAGSADISNLADNVAIVWRNRRKEDELAGLQQKLAARLGKTPDELTASDHEDAPADEKAAIRGLLAERDAYFIIDKQRGGEGHCPVRNLWFHRPALQFVERPVNPLPGQRDGRPVPYWEKTADTLDEEEQELL